MGEHPLLVDHMEHHPAVVAPMEGIMVVEVVEVLVDMKEELEEKDLVEDLVDPMIGSKSEGQMVGVLSHNLSKTLYKMQSVLKV